MISSMGFQICSLIYVIILIIIFLYKKKYHSLENNVYKYMLIVSIFTLLMDIMSVFTINKGDINSPVTIFYAKGYIVCLILWLSLITLYTILSESKVVYKDIYKAFNNSKAIKMWTFIVSFVIGVCLALPLYFHKDPVYTYGPCSNFAYGCGVIGIFIVLLLLIINKNKLENSRRIAMLSFISILIIFTGFQFFNEDILLISSGMSLVTVFMYFILENPDLKYIAELNELKIDAESANRAKTDFLASMSHEIRTPMNAIIGLTDSALSNELPDNVKEDIKNINNAGQILLEIINNILDISKIEEGKLEIVNNEYNFGEVVNQLINLITVRISEKPIKFTTYIDNGIPSKLYGDETKMFQIMLNILNNAVKYTERGEIHLAIEPKFSGDIVTLVIKVKDTGIGIKKEDYDKLFEKFSRVDLEKNQTIEGTGLGLVITKEMVTLMGGKITFTSEYHKGTEFIISIPQKIIDRQGIGFISEESTYNDNIDYFDCSRYKVLIVDDNKLNIKVIEKLLKPYNCQVTSVTSGLACLSYTKKTKYDLIFLDHMMPEMDGIKTLKGLKQRASGFNTPVVALTANAISGMKEMYLNEGFDEYVSKPIDVRKLYEVLKKYLNKS